MIGEFFLAPTFFIVAVSYLAVRAAAIALMMTGLDEQKARFQALSAFSGTGFTTREAELVVNHPQRRRIIVWLMILGNAGVVTVIVTATSSVVTSKGYHLAVIPVALLLGTFLLYKLLSHNTVIRRWERYIERRLVRSAAFEEGVAEDLLHLVEGYGMLRVIVTPQSPYLGAAVSSIGLSAEPIRIIGIERQMRWIPFPGAEETLLEGDKFVVYGRLAALNQLFREEPVR